MKKADVWMPLYIGDYLSDTMHLTTEQHGAYLLLIMAYWRKGKRLPNDDSQLAAIARVDGEKWKTIGPVVRSFFVEGEEGLSHERIEREMENATKNKGKRAASGAKGASAKWGDSVENGKVARSERLANARRLARHSPQEWQALKELCGCCVKCGSTDDIVKDHIKPIYQGGSDGIDNLQPLCRKCNASKGPEDIDYRESDWKERLAKCMANDCPSPSPSPSLKDQEHCPQQAADGHKLKFSQIRDCYNRICSPTLPACRADTDARKRQVSKLVNLQFDGVKPFREYGMEFVERFFADCLTNPHWTGSNDRNWRADFDFVTNEKNAIKLLERICG